MGRKEKPVSISSNSVLRASSISQIWRASISTCRNNERSPAHASTHPQYLGERTPAPDFVAPAGALRSGHEGTAEVGRNLNADGIAPRYHVGGMQLQPHHCPAGQLQLVFHRLAHEQGSRHLAL